MSKRFYTNIDLRLNELLKSRLENIDSTSVVAGDPGRVFYATDLNRAAYWDGSTVRTFFYKGEALDPRTISQTGDSTESIYLSTQDQKDSWDNLANDATNFERQTNKNQNDGYAGLDSAGKLILSTLWDGMVIPAVDGTTMMTLGDALNVGYGVPQLDINALLDPHILRQTGWLDSDPVKLVSQEQINNWDSGGNDGTNYELLANKGAADGYAGLDADAYGLHENAPDGVIIRNSKQVIGEWTDLYQVGNEISYTFDGGTTRTVVITNDLNDAIIALAALVNSTSPENLSLSATPIDGTSVNITGINPGENYDIVFSSFGAGGVSQSVISHPWYDLSNIGGVSTIGMAPLNASGVIEDQYLPDYKDIRVRDTYNTPPAGANTLLGITDQYNGLRVHVIDASDDTGNPDSSGWAEYIWLEDTTAWSRTAEREAAIDVQHDSLLGVLGDGDALNPKQNYHLTLAQVDQLNKADYTTQYANVDVAAADPFTLFSFDTTAFRAFKINMTVEDHDGNTTFITEVAVLWDGNRGHVTEYGRLGSPVVNDFLFSTTHDINNVYLNVTSASTDASFFLHLKKFDMIDPTIVGILGAGDDLLPGENVFPDLP